MLTEESGQLAVCLPATRCHFAEWDGEAFGDLRRGEFQLVLQADQLAILAG